MTGNPVEYAETNLEVHKTYEDAEAAHARLEELQASLEEEVRLRRHAADRLEKAEADLVARKRAENPDISQSQFDRQLKGWMLEDEDVKKYRGDHAKHSGSAFWYENQVRAQEFKIKIKVARMHQIGGYLEYLAAAKQAQSMARGTSLDTPKSSN